jgi:hypothetical protein
MAYKQKGFSPFTAPKENYASIQRRKKKLKKQKELQAKIDKFNLSSPTYNVGGEKLSEQIKSYKPSNKPGSKYSTIISDRQLTKTTPTETGFEVSKSDDFLMKTRKKDFEKGNFRKKDRIAKPTSGKLRGVAIAKTFQGKRPVDELQGGKTFEDRGDRGAENRFASSELARIGKDFKPRQKYGIIQKGINKLNIRKKIKGKTLKEVDANKAFKESYQLGFGKTKKTRRAVGSARMIRDKVKSRKGISIRKTGEGFLGLQNRKRYHDGELYEKPKSNLFNRSKIKPPKQKKVKPNKSNTFANMKEIKVTPKIQSRRNNKANRQQKRADRKKKLLAAANMKSMRNFEEKFN